MTRQEAHDKLRWVVLENIIESSDYYGCRFWTTNSDDNIHGNTGEVWYREILFTDNMSEAIEACYNRGYK